MDLQYTPVSDMLGNKRHVTSYEHYFCQVVEIGNSDFSKYGNYYVIISHDTVAINTLWDKKAFNTFEAANNYIVNFLSNPTF